MNRDDAIKAVQVAALKKWAPRMDGLTTWEAGVVVDAVDPIIRAAERERIGERYPRFRDYLSDEIRADLRAKVGELTKTALLSHKRYWNGETVVRVRDVLALLPEEASE